MTTVEIMVQVTIAEMHKLWSKLLTTRAKLLSQSKILQGSAIGALGFITIKYLKQIFDRYQGYPNGPFGWIPLIGSAYKTFNEKYFITTCGLYGAISYFYGFGNHFVFINDSNVAKNYILNHKKLLGL